METIVAIAGVLMVLAVSAAITAVGAMFRSHARFGVQRKEMPS